MNTLKRLNRLLLGLFILLSSFTLQAQDEAELKPFTQAELEQILAPIALYPDTVLSHILIASTYPLEVIQAERWALKNTDYKGSDAVEAVNDKDWDPSVKALAAFPEILTRLSENLEWTQKLGDAFLQNEEKLLASVQSLRQRAYENGNLDKMDKMKVSVEDDSSIIIEPRDREVVYVPYYDTRVVYGSWYWAHNPPVYWSSPYFANHHYDRHRSPFYWGPRIHVSFGHFFSSFLWHDHHIVRIPYHHYTPNHYYDRHQIASHQHRRRWTHNPTHRRGVSYRSVTVSNRYRAENNSRRPSRTEVRNHRNNSYSTRDRVTSERSKERQGNRVNNVVNRRSNTLSTIRNNSRIATPNRIREELRDGRISIKERNSRPTVNTRKSPVSRARTDNLNTRNNEEIRTDRRAQTTQRQSPPKQERAQRSPPKESRSSRSNGSRSSSSRSNSSSSSRSKSPSNSNRSSRSKERR